MISADSQDDVDALVTDSVSVDTSVGTCDTVEMEGLRLVGEELILLTLSFAAGLSLLLLLILEQVVDYDKGSDVNAFGRFDRGRWQLPIIRVL